MTENVHALLRWHRNARLCEIKFDHFTTITLVSTSWKSFPVRKTLLHIPFHSNVKFIFNTIICISNVTKFPIRPQRPSRPSIPLPIKTVSTCTQNLSLQHAYIRSGLPCAILVHVFRQSPTKQMKQNRQNCQDTFHSPKTLPEPPLPLSMLCPNSSFNRFVPTLNGGTGVCFIYFCRGVSEVYIAIIGSIWGKRK